MEDFSKIGLLLNKSGKNVTSYTLVEVSDESQLAEYKFDAVFDTIEEAETVGNSICGVLVITAVSKLAKYKP